MACAGKSNSLPRALSEVGPDGNARRITPHQFEAILKKEVHLSNYKKRFTYLRVDNIVNSILAGSSYHQALSEHATQDNFFENHPGRRDPASPSLYHLIAALRALRFLAEDLNNAPSDGQTVFTTQHLFELMRVLYCTFVQERDNARDSDAVILKHEQVFSAGASDRDCDRDILYRMYHLCYTLADASIVRRFNDEEQDDCNQKRLRELTNEHRDSRTQTQYVDGGYYYQNETGESTLFHVLPLDSGRIRHNGWRHVTIQEAQFIVPTSTEYRRDNTVVRVQAYSKWLWRGLGNGEQEHSRADEVVADANDGNRDAARILMSYCFENDVVFGSSPASAWCRYTKEGYEELGEYLTLKAAVLALGMPLQTENGEFVIRSSVGGRIAYLKLNDAGDIVIDWRVPESSSFLARKYLGFPGDARLVCA